MRKLYLMLALWLVVFAAKANVNLNLSALNPPTTQFRAGIQDASVLLFYASRQGADSVITRLTFQRFGISDDNTAEIYLYNQGNFIAKGNFIAGQIVFNNLHISLQIINAAIDVRVNVNANTTSTTFGVKLTGLSTLITPNQGVSTINGNTHFISIAPVVFNNQVHPMGLQINTPVNSPLTVWSTNFSVSTTKVFFDTVTYNLTGTIPMSAISNPMLFIDGHQYAGLLTGSSITFVVKNSADTLSPGLHNMYVTLTMNTCITGLLFTSIDEQKMMKYGAFPILWEEYTPSGSYPLTGSVYFNPCFSYSILQENTGTNSYYARFVLNNVPFSSADPYPSAVIYMWDNLSWSNQTINLYWNGNQYEGFVHFSPIEAEHLFVWQVNTTINGVLYAQSSTQQGAFWFFTKTCYQAYPAKVVTENITENSATLSGLIVQPPPAAGTDWYSRLYVLDEQRKNVYPTNSFSLVFSSVWQTPTIDTIRGSYNVFGLDSCTNYSYWFEWQQPCGGLTKSEIGHFRTKGNCRTEESKLFIFPNPASTTITIRFDYGRDVGQEFGIYDMTGRLIKKGKVASSQMMIDVTSYPAGMYIVRMFRPDGELSQSVSGKFLKQ